MSKTLQNFIAFMFGGSIANLLFSDGDTLPRVLSMVVYGLLIAVVIIIRKGEMQEKGVEK